MAGSSALLSASAARAETVQITLLDSKLTLSTNTINADVTGDDIADLPNLNFFQSGNPAEPRYANGKFYSTAFNQVGINSDSVSGTTMNPFGGKRFGQARALFYKSSNSARTANYKSQTKLYASAGAGNTSGTGINQSLSSLIPVTLTDARINGGTPTDGFIEVRAFNSALDDHTVQFVRVIFDDASTNAPAADAGDPPFTESPISPKAIADKAALAADRARILRQIRKLKKKIKRLKRKSRSSKNRRKIRKLKKKVKKQKRRLRAL